MEVRMLITDKSGEVLDDFWVNHWTSSVTQPKDPTRPRWRAWCANRLNSRLTPKMQSKEAADVTNSV